MTGHAVELQTLTMSRGPSWIWEPQSTLATYTAKCVDCSWSYESTMRPSRDRFADAHSRETDPDHEPEPARPREEHRVGLQQLHRHPEGRIDRATCSCSWNTQGTPSEVRRAVAGHVTNHR